MRVAFIAHFRGGVESGIYHKIATQISEWSRLGADVGLFAATSEEAAAAWAEIPGATSIRTPFTGPMGRLRAREALALDVLAWQPNAVYLRHSLPYPGVLRIARRYPTIIEVNADDLAEFRVLSPSKYLLARSTRGLLLRAAAGLVFVTHELARRRTFTRYGKPGIVVPNGVRLADFTPAPPANGDRVRLLFLGHPHTPWHGLDHVEQLATLFPEWSFDVVGPDLDELTASAPGNLTAHGILDRQGFRPMAERADAAIGTLGAYRKGLEEASPLKTREYLAYGLPVIVGYRDSDFLDGAPFLLQIPNRPDGVLRSREAIRGFVERWKGHRVARSAIVHLDSGHKERARLQFIERMATTR